ncbi:hypothetical protein ACOWLB_03910 [Helicobacter pylori]
MNTTALSMSRLYERMLNCPVAVISGYRTYNDKAIIADYGLKEATKILELNATTKGEKKEEVEALLKPFMLTNTDNERRTKWLRKKLDLYKGYIGYKIVKGYYREAGMPQANIETSFICFELKPFHNKNQFKDIIVNLGREFNQDSIIINSPKDKRGAVFTLICTTHYPYLMLDGKKQDLENPLLN